MRRFTRFGGSARGPIWGRISWLRLQKSRSRADCFPSSVHGAWVRCDNAPGRVSAGSLPRSPAGMGPIPTRRPSPHRRAPIDRPRALAGSTRPRASRLPGNQPLRRPFADGSSRSAPCHRRRRGAQPEAHRGTSAATRITPCSRLMSSFRGLWSRRLTDVSFVRRREARRAVRSRARRRPLRRRGRRPPAAPRRRPGA